jgi:hypothetical protein
MNDLGPQLTELSEYLIVAGLPEQAAAVRQADYRQLLTIGTQLEALRQQQPADRPLAEAYDRLFLVLLEARNTELSTGLSPLPVA